MDRRESKKLNTPSRSTSEAIRSIAERIIQLCLNERGAQHSICASLFKSLAVREKAEDQSTITNLIGAVGQSSCDYRLSSSIGRPWQSTVDAWVGPRLFLTKLPNQHWSSSPLNVAVLPQLASVVSSQTSKVHADDPAWNRMLEKSVQYIHRFDSALLLNPAIPVSDRIAHAAQRAGISTICVHVADPKTSLNQWLSCFLHELLSHQTNEAEELHHASSQVLVSPICLDGFSPDPELEKLPVVDRLQVCLPDQVFAIRLGPKSKTRTCVLRRLNSSQFPTASVHVSMWLDDEKREENQVAKEMIHAGAVGLVLRPVEDPKCICPNNDLTHVDFPSCLPTRTLVARFQDWFPRSGDSNWRFLTHCTRKRDQRWPDQSHEQYLDELFMVTQKQRVGEGSPLESLLRILHMRRLVATGWYQRSKVPAICFSEVPLLELLGRRKFQSHLGRWDWEPFGICIQKSMMQTLGARPVEYLPAEEYVNLTPDRQPFFQKLNDNPTPHDSHSSKTRDWTVEREWRLVGDLRMKSLAPESAFVFVPNLAIARFVASQTEYPVLAVSE